MSVVYAPSRTSKVPVCAVAGRAVGEGQEVVVGVTVVAFVVGVGVFSWKDYLSKCCVEGLSNFVKFSFFVCVTVDDSAISETRYGRGGFEFVVVVSWAL